jgi:hypothetical protein
VSQWADLTPTVSGGVTVVKTSWAKLAHRIAADGTIFREFIASGTGSTVVLIAALTITTRTYALCRNCIVSEIARRHSIAVYDWYVTVGNLKL